MPTLNVSPDLQMHYLIDDFTDPWTKPETILLLHGNSESSAAWFAWVPQLARRFRVIRPDMRGFGASTAMPREFRWTLDIIIDDYIALMDKLETERFHLVGAKIGGTVARALAALHPQRVMTLTLIGAPPPFMANRASLTAEFEEHGVEHWARRTMGARLGNTFPAEGVDWWIRFMGRAPLSTQLGFMETIPHSDIRNSLPKIACPTLVITGEGSRMSPVEETRSWQEAIPNSELLVVPGSSYHVAVTDAERCAKATLEFIERKGQRPTFARPTQA
jgi:pimeloyl-ACP methyl ester carboxylesterase